MQGYTAALRPPRRVSSPTPLPEGRDKQPWTPFLSLIAWVSYGRCDLAHENRPMPKLDSQKFLNIRVSEWSAAQSGSGSYPLSFECEGNLAPPDPWWQSDSDVCSLDQVGPSGRAPCSSGRIRPVSAADSLRKCFHGESTQ